MESLTLEELELLENWYYCMYSYNAVWDEKDRALLEKIKQAIKDKEIETRPLNF